MTATTDLKFSWRMAPNPNCANLQTRVKFPHLVGSNPEDLAAMSDHFRLFFKAIIVINGVREVWTDDYDVAIFKGVMFEWDEIKPLVERQFVEFAKTLNTER